MITKLFILIAVIGLMSSCREQDSENSQDSVLHWNYWNNPISFNGIYQTEMRICIAAQKSVGAPTIDRAQITAIDALRTWAIQVRRLSRYATTKVVYSCASPHYRIIIYTSTSFARLFNSQLRSFVKTEQVNTIYTHDGAVNAPGVLLHEFGHAFAGLGDTYVNGGNYDCQPGQPASLMCSHFRFGSKLMTDDLDGLKNVYAINFGDYLTSQEFFGKEFGPYLDAVISSSTADVKFSDLKPKVTNVIFKDGFPDQILLTMTRPSGSNAVNASLDSKLQLAWTLAHDPKQETQRFFTELRNIY
jgi:hypothetical protein